MGKIDTSNFSAQLHLTFSRSAVDAIKEERELRTSGTSFWDSFRRISFFQAVGRVLLLPFTFFLSQYCASSWQAARDRETMRPRALRKTSDGNVYAGTVERNAMRDDLRATLKPAATTQPPSSEADHEKIPTEAWKNFTSGLDSGEIPQELRHSLPAVCARTRELVADFGKTHFGEPTKPWLTEPVAMYVDMDRKEIIFEISQKWQYGPETKETSIGNLLPETAEASAVVRVSFAKELDVRVVSLGGSKKTSSLIGDPKDIIPDRKNLKSIGAENRVSAFGEEIDYTEFKIDSKTDKSFEINKADVPEGDASENNAVAEEPENPHHEGPKITKYLNDDDSEADEFFLEPKSESLNTADQRSAQMSKEGTIASAMISEVTYNKETNPETFYFALAHAFVGQANHTGAMITALKGYWNSTPEELEKTHPKTQQKESAKIKAEFKDWSLDKEKNSINWKPEDIERHARITSVLLNRPIVILSGEGTESGLSVKRYDPSGLITEPTDLRECFYPHTENETELKMQELPLPKDEAPIFLRERKGDWEVCKFSPKAAERANISSI